MCDADTVRESERYLDARGGVSRRQFAATAALTTGALAMTLPGTASAQPVAEHDVMISTPDGEADAFFAHPSDGAHPAVIVWPDVLGLRPAHRVMAKRLAQEGYAVLVINPFYRMARAPVVEPGASFQDADTRAKVLPLARALTPETNLTDAAAVISWLDRQDAVDSARRMGTTGYCMGGPMTFRTAAGFPDRIGAGASFHGGGLATDAEDSPHLLIPGMQANFLIAIAENDDEREPQAKEVLRASFEAAGRSAEIEVYEEAMHGWCVVDSRVYHEAQAERAWARLLALLSASLV